MLKTLGAIPLFASIEKKDLAPLVQAQDIYLKNYREGVTLYNQKEVCQTFDMVLSGSLVAYSLAENGSAMTLFEFPPGQILGANLLFSPQGLYPFNIYCMAQAQVLHVTRRGVEALLHHYDFTLAFIKMLSLNSNRLNQKITMVTQKTLRENLLDYLQEEVRRQGTNPLSLPMSKKQLADYLGVQRPSLFRELKKLKDEGLIQVDNKKIYLAYL
ncbi:MAG: Crp/Fnr family transcriptional regulator [Tissierellia bacterium]|nr:Crp/Fnr family transcriptional regulator [Tissierellia bacterium]